MNLGIYKKRNEIKMKIGLSACLLGEKCRYDGAGNKDNFIVEQLSKYFEFVPYCPEAIIFGTPSIL